MISIPDSFKKRGSPDLDWFKDGTMVYDGFTQIDSRYVESLAEGWGHFSYVEGWDDGPYRSVFVSDRWLSLFTYCEGDLTLEVCQSAEAYKAAITRSHDCYVAENSNYLSGAFTGISSTQPLAKEAIRDLPKDWCRYRVTTSSSRVYSLTSPELLYIGFDLDAARVAFEKHLDQVPQRQRSFTAGWLSHPSGASSLCEANLDAVFEREKSAKRDEFNLTVFP